MTAWHETRAASKVWAQRWTEVRSAAPVLNVYVLLDLAQNPYLHSRLPAQAAQALFGFEGDSKEARAMPWLVQLGSSQQSMGPKQQALLDEVLALVQTSPCATLIASPCDLSALAAHLRLAMDVRLQGQASMYLAFWDPAILAALMGQSDLETRSRLEPVLQPAQSRALLGPIAYWWCWSRSGRLHEYAASQESTKAAAGLPLQLSRAQVDALVQASVPDLLIYYLRLNQPLLAKKLEPLSLHWFVRQQIELARSYGLEGTRDLLNYVTLALLWGARFDQSLAVAPVLARVKAARLAFDKAMEQIDEKALQPDVKAPQVLLDETGLPLSPIPL